jgi:NADH-quinone oxidoreductase subunit E
MVRFYNLFTFESKGRHLINVCLGTVCHIKGGGELLRELERELGLNCGETTSDFMFTLDKVRCLGCWSLAPVVKVDKRIYSWCKGEEYAQSFTW